MKLLIYLKVEPCLICNERPETRQSPEDAKSGDRSGDIGRVTKVRISGGVYRQLRETSLDLV
jgi:hypothetical protein